MIERNEKILETFRINENAKYFLTKYFSYCPFNGMQYEMNQTQLHFLKLLTSNEKEVNVIASRQRGTTSTMIEYAFWDAFLTGRTHRTNVLILPVLSRIGQVRDILYNSMELARDDILESTGMDIMDMVSITEKGAKDKKCNSIQFGSIGTLATTIRGKHISTLYMDNTWIHKGSAHENDIATLKVARTVGTRIVMLQTGLFGNIPSYVEEQPNVVLLPDIINENYTISHEEDYINKIGAKKFAQEYLLQRIP